MEKTKVKIAFLSTYPPRECGIATFTKSLVKIFEGLYVKNQVKIIAVSDNKKTHYSPRVIYNIDQFDPKSYVEAARAVNKSSIEVVVIQHEYGIYGGDDGKYILKFMENVNKPVIVNFHTVLRDHSERRKKLTQRIIDLSSAIILMTNNSKKIMQETFDIEPSKIKLVPHGVPNVRFDEKKSSKELLGYKDKTLLMTFGLINRGKGIENAIEAMAEVVKEHPEALYLVVGATHPTILKREGESYRRELEKLVDHYKLKQNVQFVNKYLDYDELVEYLKAADIYLAPQLDFKQAVSGTLSYAMGCGCAIISSPTSHATGVLSQGRGIVVTPEKENITRELKRLLGNHRLMEDTGLKAYKYARNMVWPSAGLAYLKVIESYMFERGRRPWVNRIPNFDEKPKTKYLSALTDDFGVVQHANHDIPDMRFGYSLDDEARAMMVCKYYLDIYEDNDGEIARLLETYLSFLEKAIDKNGTPHNFIDRNRKYSDDIASPHSRARSFWALSSLIGSKRVDKETIAKAKKLLAIYESSIENSGVKQAAFNLMGYCQQKKRKKVEETCRYLLTEFEKNSGDNWHWFEDKLTWGNAIIPYALIKAYRLISDDKILKVAQKSINFLEASYCEGDIPSPVGQDGWFFRGKKRARFDQQPIEAADMVLMYNELYSFEGEKKYRDKAISWMGWYFGNNIKQAVVYDNVSGAVYDGITRTGINENRGAESVVTYLLAYLSFKTRI